MENHCTAHSFIKNNPQTRHMPSNTQQPEQFGSRILLMPVGACALLSSCMTITLFLKTLSYLQCMAKVMRAISHAWEWFYSGERDRFAHVWVKPSASFSQRLLQTLVTSSLLALKRHFLSFCCSLFDICSYLWWCSLSHIPLISQLEA